jgi:diguanylate cyclase (GGDEF)-like protein
MELQRAGSLSDLSDRPASTRTRRNATVFMIVTCVAAIVSTAFLTQGATMPTFVPVVASIWAAAELLTAYLLISQFLVNGVRLFLALGAAFTFSGLLTLPYLASFPGALGSPGPADGRQIAVVIWSTWHLVFPAIVAAGLALDHGTGARILDRARMRGDAVLVLTLVTSVCIALTAATVAFRGVLPTLVAPGGFTPLFGFAVVPTIAVANVTVALLALRRRPLTALHVWLAVALAVAALDAGLQAVGGRYSPSWYVGKALTLTTASVLLFALLAEVAALYRRVGALAMNDSLTGLRNRRTFDTSMAWAFKLLRRQHGEVAVLMIDVDFFKGFNDRYGHPAGDVCLCRVGAALHDTLRRGDDVVARYGGEEFAALLPLASLESATEIAERLRVAVQALHIPYPGGVAGVGVVTISVGVGYTHDITADDPTSLMAVADHALYTAKERRNVVVTETRTPLLALASA